MLQEFDLGWPRGYSLHDHTFPKLAESFLVRQAFHLGPICAGMRKFGIDQPVLEYAVIGEKEQAFTIVIETAHGINIFHVNVITQSLALAGKLRNHAVGFMKEYVMESQARTA